MLRAAHSSVNAHATQRHGDRTLAMAASELAPSLTSFSAFVQETVQFLEGDFVCPDSFLCAIIRSGNIRTTAGYR